MSTVTRKPRTHIPERHSLRWMIRWEPTRDARLGEPQRLTHQWTVRPYIGRHSDGSLIGAGHRVPFTSLPTAIAHARAEMARIYKGGVNR